MSPTRTVHEALERHGCNPHGSPHAYRARCPVHDGTNPESLSVTEGADGRVLVHCFSRHCQAEEIVAAIGLDIADLFPPGHHRARRRHLREARRLEFTGNLRMVANVLAAVGELDADWFIEVRFDCPRCGSPAAVLQASERFVGYHCPGDSCAATDGFAACTLSDAIQALAGRLDAQDERRAAA